MALKKILRAGTLLLAALCGPRLAFADVVEPPEMWGIPIECAPGEEMATCPKLFGDPSGKEDPCATLLRDPAFYEARTEKWVGFYCKSTPQRIRKYEEERIRKYEKEKYQKYSEETIRKAERLRKAHDALLRAGVVSERRFAFRFAFAHCAPGDKPVRCSNSLWGVCERYEADRSYYRLAKTMVFRFFCRAPLEKARQVRVVGYAYDNQKLFSTMGGGNTVEEQEEKLRLYREWSISRRGGIPSSMEEQAEKIRRLIEGIISRRGIPVPPLPERSSAPQTEGGAAELPGPAGADRLLVLVGVSAAAVLGGVWLWKLRARSRRSDAGSG